MITPSYIALIQSLTSDPIVNVAARPTLEQIARDSNMRRGRFAELYRMFYEHGPGNGTFLGLPFDQLVEHGVGHTQMWERSADPRAVIELAHRGNFSAVALSIGQSEKYVNLIGPSFPLIVKVDGHFSVGDEVSYDRHSNMSSVDRAVDLGANAIGFTLYFGGRDTMHDIERAAYIIEAAHKADKPVFMWAYARGPLASKMGDDSLYWCAAAISAGESLGADVVKQKFPRVAKDRGLYEKDLSTNGYFHSRMPDISGLMVLEPERSEELTDVLNIKRVAWMVSVAPHTLVLISGGPKGSEDKVYETARLALSGGAEGLIVGRNFWGRPTDEALKMANTLTGTMRDPTYHRKLSEPRFAGVYR